MAVRIARVYDEAGAEDGVRVLVDRLWPRGLSKDRARIDIWVKDIAPSAELRRWYGHDPDKSSEFARRYREELANEPAATALADLVSRAGHGTVTLLTATKDLDLSQAHVLRDVLSRGHKGRRGPAGT